MLGRRPIPVYLFTGFLDGGKTSFIRQTMDEGQFKDQKTTLYIICEEGEESVDIMRLNDNKVYSNRSSFFSLTENKEKDWASIPFAEILSKFPFGSFCRICTNNLFN